MTARTVRVRIAVAIDRTGAWETMRASNTEFVGPILDDFKWHWIEANVPIPVREEPVVIEGRVSDAK